MVQYTHWLALHLMSTKREKNYIDLLKYNSRSNLSFLVFLSTFFKIGAGVKGGGAQFCVVALGTKGVNAGFAFKTTFGIIVFL